MFAEIMVSDFVDQPHFQLQPAWGRGLSRRELLAELRKCTAKGAPLYP